MMSSYYYHHDGHHLLWCICEVVAPRHTLMMRKRQASKTPPETLARIDPKKKKKTGGKDPLPTLNRLHLGKSGKVDVYCGDAKQTARANKKKLKILSQSTQVSRTPIRSDTSRSWCEFCSQGYHERCHVAPPLRNSSQIWGGGQQLERLGFWMFLRKHNPNCHGRFTFSIYTSINMSCLKCKR